ncbi:unnamed protein product [Bemisia tabaci]|uniref:Uncharacterized protein n=1 Tax=Bemisia tabaci TaxID=7038 RepID=A0A9P0A764_BEMTA|nr:unnamed protein product [Bemisia tabaci]
MTVITKPISGSKSDKLQDPLVVNEQLKQGIVRSIDTRLITEPTPHRTEGWLRAPQRGGALRRESAPGSRGKPASCIAYPGLEMRREYALPQGRAVQSVVGLFVSGTDYNSIVFLESSPASYNSSGFPICSSKNPIDSRVFFESLNSESKRLFFPVQVNELTSSFALFVDTSLSTKITSNCVLIENCRKGRKVAT